MKLVFASSLSHDILKRHVFLGTLCDPWDLIELRFRVAGSGNFGTPDYHRVVLDRAAMALDIVRRSSGEIVVFSDVDVQWFRPAQDALKEALGEQDIVFQREMPDRDVANCGFICARCNQRTADYFAALADAAAQGTQDQQATHAMISRGRMPCHFGFLPTTFFNDHLSGKARPQFSDMIMYHTIGTFPTGEKTSVQIKLERHLSMRATVLGSPNILRPASGVETAPAGKTMKYRPVVPQTIPAAQPDHF